MGQNAEEDARERRDAWLAEGAPDYAAPTYDSGGNVSGYQSVADQPAEMRSQENQNLPSLMAWLGGGASDYNKPIYDAAGNVTGYQSVTATPAAERSLANQALERMLAGFTQRNLQASQRPVSGVERMIGGSAAAPQTASGWTGGLGGQQPWDPRLGSGNTSTPPEPSGYRPNTYTNDVASELAARRYAEQFSVPLEVARIQLQAPEAAAYREAALGMARAGQLDYLMGGQSAATPAVGNQPTTNAGQNGVRGYAPTALPTAPGVKAGSGSLVPGTTSYQPYQPQTALPGMAGDGADPLQGVIDQLTRRSQLLGTTLAPGKARDDRTLAALYQNVPGIREMLASDATLDISDWRGAVKKWAASQNITDLDKYAVDAGFMAKAPPRTVADLVDQGVYDILKKQGLITPEKESGLNAQLEAQYQADLTGAEPPTPPAAAESAAFMPPIPSTQMYNSGFNAAEQEGVAQLFSAMGMTPQMLADQIRRLAPPGGGASQAVMTYRRR